MSDLQDRMDDARCVVDALANFAPFDLPHPDIAADEEGDLVFTWFMDRENQISLWARDHRISFAGLCDGEGAHGIAETLEVLPTIALELLLAVTQKMVRRPS